MRFRVLLAVLGNRAKARAHGGNVRPQYGHHLRALHLTNGRPGVPSVLVGRPSERAHERAHAGLIRLDRNSYGIYLSSDCTDDLGET